MFLKSDVSKFKDGVHENITRSGQFLYLQSHFWPKRRNGMLLYFKDNFLFVLQSISPILHVSIFSRSFINHSTRKSEFSKHGLPESRLSALDKATWKNYSANTLFLKSVYSGKIIAIYRGTIDRIVDLS